MPPDTPPEDGSTSPDDEPADGTPDAGDQDDATTDRPDDGSGEPNVPDPGEFLDRRTVIKILLALAFGIPIAIEGWTFVELIQQRLFGDGDDDGEPATTTREPTGVGVGDELLASTPQTETVEAASIDPEEDRWTVSMTVLVANDAGTDDDYQFRMISITGREGTTVPRTVETDRLAPGESQEISGEWDLPTEERPAEARVAATTFPPDGDPTTTVENVELAGFPLRN